MRTIYLDRIFDACDFGELPLGEVYGFCDTDGLYHEADGVAVNGSSVELTLKGDFVALAEWLDNTSLADLADITEKAKRQ